MAGCGPAIQRAMAHLPARDFEQLDRTLDADGVAFDALVDALTVGETYFFRDPRQFTFLREQAIPDLVRRRAPTHVLSVWSAGCATGEEPYSLAILLQEMGLAGRRRILGTDISRHRLTAARRARYGKWSLRGVAPHVVQRYFRRDGRDFELRPEIRDAVRFEYVNLAADISPAIGAGGLDLIVCRNVLIYLDAETVSRAARAMVERLADGGWLLLGPSDPPLMDAHSCEVVITDAGLAYRKRRRTVSVAAPPAALAPGMPRDARVVGSSAPGYGEAAVTPVSVVAAAPAGVTRADGPPSTRGETMAKAHRALERREYDEAARWARECLRDDDAESAHVVLVRALSNVGRMREAALAAAAALEAHPVSAELMVLQSLILSELGRHADALDTARRALYLDRELAVAHLASGAVLLHAGERAAARRAFVNALRLLQAMDSGATVRASGGEPATRLVALARAQLRLLDTAP